VKRVHGSHFGFKRLQRQSDCFAISPVDSRMRFQLWAVAAAAEKASAADAAQAVGWVWRLFVRIFMG
jgi:hypothetical protein